MWTAPAGQALQKDSFVLLEGATDESVANNFFVVDKIKYRCGRTDVAITVLLY